jgi:hypothetical protein
VIVHYVPELHPDDVCTVNGIPTTSPSRTLIEFARRLGTSASRMSSYVNGSVVPSATLMVRARNVRRKRK